MEWTVELEDREACENLMVTVEKFEKASRKEQEAQMKVVFQLNDRNDILEQARYEEEVERRQSKEKEKAAGKQIDIEMRSVEINVRGMKRKAFRKETPEEKAARDRAQSSKEAAFGHLVAGSSSSNYLGSSCRCHGRKGSAHNRYHQ